MERSRLTLRSVIGVVVVATTMMACTAIPRTPQEAFAAYVRGDVQTARRAYVSMIARAPDSMSAALARDFLMVIDGRQVFTPRRYSCPDAGAAAFKAAEEHFLRRQFQDAVPDYQRAVDLCPDNADVWVNYGDAFFSMGDYRQARELFGEGLKRDPWNRAGHRFLADAEAHLGNGFAAYQQDILAVVSDPTYEAGWQYLREATLTMGGRWNRSFVVKPTMSMEGDHKVLHVTDDPGSEVRLETNNSVWIVYAILASPQSLPPRDPSLGEGGVALTDPPSDWSTLSALDRERYRVNEALKLYRTVLAKDPSRESRFWKLMEQADRAGFLSDAIFIHLIDRDLVADYVQYRESHWQRLTEYIATLVAPIPDPGSRTI